MTTNDDQNQYLTPELSFTPHDSMSEKDKSYYIEQHKKLFKMKKNQLQLFGIDLIQDQEDKIIVTSFIRNTVKKPIQLKKSTIVLLNNDSEPITKTEVDFTCLGVLQPNTSIPWQFEFHKDSAILNDLQNTESWSLAFQKPSEHRLDLSDMDEEAMSKASKVKLEKILQQSSLEENELSLMGLSAKQNENDGLEITLLGQNGTKDDLEIKKIPLKFYDATGDLTAQGTFKLADFIIKANTSKPMTLVFPKSGLLKEPMDLSSWSLEHVR